MNILSRGRSFIDKTPALLFQQFVCAEYSSDFLMQLFDIDTSSVIGPILDIGCESKGHLVHYLRKQGLQAYGFDRNAEGEDLEKKDWFKFEYGIGRWELILANLSFSSHFLYHYQKNDAIANQYAITYMKILKSLKDKGKWIYAPSIPFFEDLLPSDEYFIQRKCIHEGFIKTIVIKN